MERLISDEERIRRAEDVLERRRNTDLRISSESFVREKSNSKIKKMLIQILVCLIIYCVVFYIKNSDKQNFDSIIGGIDSVLQYDVDFPKIYSEIYQKIQEFNSKFDIKSDEQINENQDNNNGNINENSNGDNGSENNTPDQNKTENVTDEKSGDENQTLDDAQDDKQSNISEIGEELGIGGAVEDGDNNDSTVISQEEQMKIDSDFIKNSYNMIKPVNEYTITSEFGARASSEIVSANHKGIDLGAKTGTDIFSSLNGVVVEASSFGDFGTHLKIKTDDILITYAHCSKLLVKQGDNIAQGQKIAEVGSTGKATGPHLHFEIRVNSRAVDPKMVMEF